MDIYLDYSLKTPEERTALVEKILEHTPAADQTNRFLTYLSDYILFVADKGQTKKERKQNHPIVTKNREFTVSKRQISYERMVDLLENGEDGLYDLINNDKNQLLDHKDKITEEELEQYPELQIQMDIINSLEENFAAATGKQKYQLKKQIIEHWQQLYMMRASLKAPASIHSSNSGQIKAMTYMDLPEDITITPQGTLEINSPVSLMRADHIMFLLNNYSKLKEECVDNLFSDMHWLLIDFENLVYNTFRDKPVLLDLVIWKIDGISNEQIQKMMEAKYGESHASSYYSSKWRQYIPRLLSEKAQQQWVRWYYENKEYGSWRRCTKCGEWKPENPLFFSRNSTKSGYYSICKDCRSVSKNK